MASWPKRALEWIDSRLGFSAVLEHPIPKSASGPMGWWYVFGSASMTLLFLQILSGIGLVMVYVPTARDAYDSLLYLNYEQPMGWFIRALHFWSGSGMVVMVLIHMTQVFLHGSFKFPRELTWVLGVFLFLFTLGLAFSGQVLRWDTDAYWGVGVGAAMAGRVPVIGPIIVQLLLGGEIIGSSTLARFFALHVFVLPGLLLMTLALHLWLVLKQGISEAPEPGKEVDPATYHAEYEEKLKDGEPFLGDATWKDAIFSSLVVIVVVSLAAVVGPMGPSDPPDPTLSGANPRPDWPFLWLFALLSLSPPEYETFIILVFPLVLVASLLSVPFISNRGERAPSKRPAAVLLVVVLYSLFGVLTYLGHTADWSPIMDAWGSDPMPVAMVERSSPIELQGMLVFQNKNCRNCHAIDGIGGRRGPDLNGVGARLTIEQLIDQVSNGTPGGGNMPAYGKQINPAEMEVLSTFLASLRTKDVGPAKPHLTPGKMILTPTEKESSKDGSETN
ncbi:cytochrome b N-terminal domain-containing protein [bacterium]|nr:cytochrome b N-terminal domain-containing protein [bacterium]